ncbi:MAG TPA: hypothetical protein VLU25_21785 [Acidobacteriota bacterium]|nr:hypothetical protein [Acidobacteriota bacterium]
MTSSFLALILFIVAALGGLFLAVRHFKGQSLPMPVALLHGGLAAAGLILLLVAYFSGAPGLATALLILVVAALGGFFLFSFHLRGQRAPNAAVVIHALVAAAGVVMLLLVAL